MTPGEYVKKYGHMFGICRDEKLKPSSGEADLLPWMMLRDALQVIMERKEVRE